MFVDLVWGGWVVSSDWGNPVSSLLRPWVAGGEKPALLAILLRWWRRSVVGPGRKPARRSRRSPAFVRHFFVCGQVSERSNFPWCFCLQRFGCFLGGPESLGERIFPTFWPRTVSHHPGVVMRDDCGVDWDFIMEDLWVVFFSRHRSGDRKSKIVDAKFCISWWSSQGFKEKLGSPENLLGLPPQFPTLLIICVPRMIPSNFWRLTLPSSMEIGNRTTTDHRKPLPSRSAFACALSSTSIRIPGRWWARSQSPPNGIFCSEDSIPRFQGFCEKSTCPHSPILYWALMLVYDPERHTSWEDQNFPH